MSADSVLASGAQREAAIAARDRYWRSLGDDARAEAVPSPASLLAWEDVVAELSPQAVIRTARPSEVSSEVRRLAGEVKRLTAHLRTCEVARTAAEVKVSELERSPRELAPAPVFRHLYRQDQTGVGTECGRPWTTKEHEHTRGRALPVCWECVRAVLDKQEERNMTLRRERDQLQDQLRDRVRQLDQAEAKANAIAAEARGDRQARDQLVQAVRVAIREAVPDA